MQGDRKSYLVEAVLSVRDQGFAAQLQSARKELDGFAAGSENAGKSAGRFAEMVKGISVGSLVAQGVSRAFEMVKGSIDGALSRRDTMDNFNRTMTLMTGSSEKAAWALAETTKTVKDTAYGLDVAAKSVQGFVTAGMDVKKSVQYVRSWTDAISVYGDGTNEALSGVVFQLQQMATKGKANLGDLKSAMEAGVPVIKLYAAVTGESTEEVTNQISKGKISAEQFLDTLEIAFHKGAGSFKSITGGAKKAGDTWRGTFDNMAAATTRGVMSIIDSIEDGRKSANLPTMKDAVRGFGQTVEKILNGVGKVVGFVARHFETFFTVVSTGLQGLALYKVLTKAKDGVMAFKNAAAESKATIGAWTTGMYGSITAAQLYDVAMARGANTEKIRAAAKRLNIALEKEDATGKMTSVALTNAQKAAIMAETGAVSLKSLAMGVLTGQIKLTTAAQLGLNAAWKANWVGVLVTGVTLAVGALKMLDSFLFQTSEEHKKLNAEAKETAAHAKEVANSQKEVRRTFTDSTVEIRAQAQQGQRLIAELRNIQSSTDSAARKQEKMKAVVGQLNELYPDLCAEIDDTGLAIVGGTKAIEEQIKATEKLSKQKAMQEYLTSLYTEQLKNKQAIEETTRAYDELKAKGADTERSIWSFGMERETEGAKELRESLDALRESQSTITRDLAAAEQTLQVYNEEQLNAKIAAEEHARSLEELRNNYHVTSDAIVQYAEKTNQELPEVGAKVLTLADKYKVSTDAIVASFSQSTLSMDDWEKKMDELLQSATKSIETFAEQATNGFSAIEQKSTISLSEFKTTMESNIEATRNWAENVRTLMQMGVDEGIIEQLQKMGPAGAEQAALFVQELQAAGDESKKKIDSLNEVVKEGIRVSAEAAKNEATLSEAKMKSAGRKLIDDSARGVVEATHANFPKMQKAAADTVGEFQKGVNAAAAMLNMGQFLAKVATGAQGSQEIMTNSADETKEKVNRTYDQMGDGVSESIFHLPSILTPGLMALQGLFQTQTKEASDKSKGNFEAMNTDVSKSVNQMAAGVSTGLLVMTGALATSQVLTLTASMGIRSAITGAMNGLSDEMRSMGYYAGLGLQWGLAAASDGVFSTAVWIANTVANVIAAALQISSPARRTRKLGQWTTEGFGLGLKDRIPMVLSQVDRITDAALSIGGDGFRNVLDAGRSLVGSVARPVQPLIAKFSFAGRSYQAFVDDITQEQEQSANFELAYQN